MGKSRRKAKGAKVKAAANPLGLEEDAGLDAASASAARRQFEGIDSLNPSTREVACGAVASLFVSTEHGGEVERRAVHAGRIKWLKAIGMVPKLVRAVNDSHLSARVHALGAVRNMLMVGGPDMADFFTDHDLLGALMAGLRTTTSDSAIASALAAVRHAMLLREQLELLATLCELSGDVVVALTERFDLDPVLQCLAPAAVASASPVVKAAAHALYVITDNNATLAFKLAAHPPVAPLLAAFLANTTAPTIARVHVAGALCNLRHPALVAAADSSGATVLHACVGLLLSSIQRPLLGGVEALGLATQRATLAKQAEEAAAAAAQGAGAGAAEAGEDEAEAEEGKAGGDATADSLERAAKDASEGVDRAREALCEMSDAQRAALETVANAAGAAGAGAKGGEGEDEEDEEEGGAPETGPGVVERRVLMRRADVELWAAMLAARVPEAVAALVQPLTDPAASRGHLTLVAARLHGTAYRALTALGNVALALPTEAAATALPTLWQLLYSLCSSLTSHAELEEASRQLPAEAGVSTGPAGESQSLLATATRTVAALLRRAEEDRLSLPISEAHVQAMMAVVSSAPEPAARANATACVATMARLPGAPPAMVQAAASVIAAACADAHPLVVAEAAHAAMDGFADEHGEEYARAGLAAKLGGAAAKLTTLVQRARAVQLLDERIIEAAVNLPRFMEYKAAQGL